MVKKFHGQSAVLEVSGGSLGTDPIGVLQEVAVAPQQNVEELRGAGTAEWVDLQKTEIACEVTGTVMAWNLDAWDAMIDYDDVAGEMDTGADVQTFTATVTYKASDGSTKEIPVNECYFDPLPEIGGSREEWIGMDISLRGQNVGSITNTDASA